MQQKFQRAQQAERELLMLEWLRGTCTTMLGSSAMARRSKALVAAVLMLGPQGALADEASFLRTLSGSWSGGGSYVRSGGGAPVTVTCAFETAATVSTLKMRGTCRALVVISRSISSDLVISGYNYSGRYLGPEGEANLQGQRSDNSLNLALHWDQPVRGDQDARMEVRLLTPDELTLRTLDQDALTGRSIVTTDLRLRRDK